MSESYIKGKVVRGIQVNGYLTLNLLNAASKSGIDTDSLCIYIFNKVMGYKGVKSINFIDIRSYYPVGNIDNIVINANVLTSKKLYNINREYNIQFDIFKVKSELREIKLGELEI